MQDPITTSVREDGIIVMKISGDITSEEIPQFEKNIEAWKVLLLQETEEGKKQARVLVDVTDAGSNYSVETVQEMAPLMKWNKQYIEKTAIYGIPHGMELVTETLKVLSGRADIHTFKTEAEALEWLGA